MNRRCLSVCGNAIAASATAALALSLAGNSQAGTCTNDSGAGDHNEGEVCLVDLGLPAPGPTTDGCNLAPNTFDEIPDVELADGVVVICGTASNYNTNDTCDVNADCADGNCQGDPNPGDGTAEGTCVGPSEPATNRRDTDWHRVSAAALLAADIDGNGVVQLTSDVISEFDSVTFFVSLGNPTCATVTVLGGTGCGGPQSGSPQQAVETIELDDHPNGIVVFVAPGQCSGAGIFDGYECGDVPQLTDYNLTINLIEPPTGCADPDINPNLLPCNTPNGAQNGCDDPACCKLVCLQLPLCCATGWVQGCADAAIGSGCAPALGGPVCIATGPSSAADGYLQVCTDPDGGWADLTFGGQGDIYNPYGNNVSGVPLPPQPASFSNAFFLYRAAQSQRELLSNNPQWKADAQVEDASLATTINCVVPGPNCIPGSVATDVHGGDGVIDHLVSNFRVTGVGVDLTCTLTQDVQNFPASQVSVLSQVYSIKNNLASSISFVLLRQVDYDIVWQGAFGNDSVGTDTNGNPADRHVSQGENPAAGQLDHTYMTLSSPQGTAYVCAKATIDPDGAGGGPPYGAGTDVQEWDAYGVPAGWANFTPYVPAAPGSYNVNGYSGTQAGDAHVDLEIPVTIAGGATVDISIDHTYGSTIPLGAAPPCKGDCAQPPNGVVDTVDFLALLQAWGPAGAGGPCDFNGVGGVDTVDFLSLLQNWGSCP
jgi:hypothetical protein